MALAQLNNVTVSFGARHVLESVSLQLNEGERVGLVGANGSGKTTLLRAMAGSLALDIGRLDRKRGLRVGFLAQEPDLPLDANVHDAALSAFADLLDMEKRMREVEHEVASAPPERRRRLLAQLGELHSHFEHAGGYDRESRVAAVLMGLEFTHEEFTRPVSVLSGGERSRLALARLLLREADLLLLDEATNHLDLAGIEWLETFLQKKFRGAVLVVSHDRTFLDRVATKIVDLERGSLTEYPGNYSKYTALKEARRLEQQKQYEQQRAFIEKEKDFIRRYHAGQRSRQARGRQKRLDRLERLEAPVTEKKISVRFAPERVSGETCVRAEYLSKSFGERTLFADLSFEVYRKERVGILGPNGSGKTTLLRILLGQEEPSGGAVEIGHNVVFGYLEQQATDLSTDRTVLDEVWERRRTLDEVEVRAVLGRFLLSGDEAVLKRMCDLSGGERTRVALARLMVDRPNVLVLDEPTNHLDIRSRVALEAALSDYEGTLIVVSHDRYFLNQIATKLIVLESGRGRVFLGNYKDYERLRQAQSRESPQTERVKPAAKSAARDSQSGATPRRRRLSKSRLARLERDIAALEKGKTELESELARPELYTNPEKARAVPRKYEELCRQLEALYQQWMQQGET